MGSTAVHKTFWVVYDTHSSIAASKQEAPVLSEASTVLFFPYAGIVQIRLCEYNLRFHLRSTPEERTLY
jgi:hypothetical protein